MMFTREDIAEYFRAATVLSSIPTGKLLADARVLHKIWEKILPE